MKNWQSKLREADRARQGEMSPADVRRIRSTVISAAREAGSVSFAWSRSFVLTGAALSVICAVTLVALQQNVADLRQMARRVAPVGSAIAVEATAVAEKQQLHFSTPGGTRIIWVFDPAFEVKGTLP